MVVSYTLSVQLLLQLDQFNCMFAQDHFLKFLLVKDKVNLCIIAISKQCSSLY